MSYSCTKIDDFTKEKLLLQAVCALYLKHYRSSRKKYKLVSHDLQNRFGVLISDKSIKACRILITTCILANRNAMRNYDINRMAPLIRNIYNCGNVEAQANAEAKYANSSNFIHNISPNRTESSASSISYGSNCNTSLASDHLIDRMEALDAMDNANKAASNILTRSLTQSDVKNSSEIDSVLAQQIDSKTLLSHLGKMVYLLKDIEHHTRVFHEDFISRFIMDPNSKQTMQTLSNTAANREMQLDFRKAVATLTEVKPKTSAKRHPVQLIDF